MAPVGCIPHVASPGRSRARRGARPGAERECQPGPGALQRGRHPGRPRLGARAIRAELDAHYDNRVFVSGFVTNAIVAVALTFIGDRLGIDLYLVALFAFGLRIFQNVALIRRHFL